MRISLRTRFGGIAESFPAQPSRCARERQSVSVFLMPFQTPGTCSATQSILLCMGHNPECQRFGPWCIYTAAKYSPIAMGIQKLGIRPEVRRREVHMGETLSFIRTT